MWQHRAVPTYTQDSCSLFLNKSHLLCLFPVHISLLFWVWDNKLRSYWLRVVLMVVEFLGLGSLSEAHLEPERLCTLKEPTHREVGPGGRQWVTEDMSLEDMFPWLACLCSVSTMSGLAFPMYICFCGVLPRAQNEQSWEVQAGVSETQTRTKGSSLCVIIIWYFLQGWKSLIIHVHHDRIFWTPY